jgi:hypothetical protein
MSNYRRAFIPGGCFFFTVNLLERRQALLVDEIAGLRQAVTATRRAYPFTIDAFVVLPDHLRVARLRDGGLRPSDRAGARTRSATIRPTHCWTKGELQAL